MDRLPSVADAAEGVFEDEERVVGAMVVLGELSTERSFKEDEVAQFFVVVCRSKRSAGFLTLVRLDHEGQQ